MLSIKPDVIVEALVATSALPDHEEAKLHYERHLEEVFLLHKACCSLADVWRLLSLCTAEISLWDRHELLNKAYHLGLPQLDIEEPIQACMYYWLSFCPDVASWKVMNQIYLKFLAYYDSIQSEDKLPIFTHQEKLFLQRVEIQSGKNMATWLRTTKRRLTLEAYRQLLN